MSSSHADHTCVRCGHKGPWDRPHGGLKLLLAGLYLAFVLMICGAVLMGLGVTALGPLAIAVCAVIQAPLAEAAFAPARCAECRCYAPSPEVSA